MSVFKQIDYENLIRHPARFQTNITSSDSGALFYYAPTCSIQTYSASYISHSSWHAVNNLFYSPGSEQYREQKKGGFY